MTAMDLLERQTRRGLVRFVEAFREIPSDRLDWKPAPGARSALDLLQEVATMNDLKPDLYETRKLDFTPEMGAEMERRMREHTDVETLLRLLEESTEREIARLREILPDTYELPVEMPWPPPMSVLDIMGYHGWNLAYHEGQLVYIASLLARTE